MFDKLRTFVRAERKKEEEKTWIHSSEITSSTFQFDRIYNNKAKFRTNMACNEEELFKTLQSYQVLYDNENDDFQKLKINSSSYRRI